MEGTPFLQSFLFSAVRFECQADHVSLSTVSVFHWQWYSFPQDTTVFFFFKSIPIYFFMFSLISLPETRLPNKKAFGRLSPSISATWPLSIEKWVFCSITSMLMLLALLFMMKLLHCTFRIIHKQHGRVFKAVYMVRLYMTKHSDPYKKKRRQQDGFCL